MEGIAILLVVAVLGWLLIGPIIALVKAGNAQREATHAHDQMKVLLGRMKSLESELQEFKRGAVPLPVEEPAAPEPIPERVEVIQSHAVADPAVVTWLDQREAEIPAPPPLPERRKLVDYGDAQKPEASPLAAVEPKEPFSLE